MIEKELHVNGHYIKYFLVYKDIKNMYMKWRNNKIVVSANYNMPIEKIEEFVKKNGLRLAMIMCSKRNLNYEGTEKEVLYNGVETTLNVTIGKGTSFYDKGVNIYAKKEKDVPKMIELFYLNQAKMIIDSFVQEYEEFLKINNLFPEGFYVRKMRGKWGYCKYKDRKIFFSENIAKIDISIAKYLFWHEVAHLRIPNHSRLYHQFLEKLCPNHRRYEKLLAEFYF